MLILILLADRIWLLFLRGRVLLRWWERTSGFCIIKSNKNNRSSHHLRADVEYPFESDAKGAGLPLRKQEGRIGDK
jgi:hypothetical protein